MARRIPHRELEEAKRESQTGPETVVPGRGEQVYDIEVLEEERLLPAARTAPQASPLAGIQPAWTPSPPAAAPMQRPLPGWRRKCWVAVPYLFIALLVCIVIQVYLAGTWVFGASSIEHHKDFVHVFEFVPVLTAVLGFLGGRKAAGWWSIGILAAIEVQYALASTLEVTNPSRNLLMLGALHVVNALFIFGATLLLVHRYAPWRRSNRTTAAA